MAEPKELSLVKGPERFVFRYESGDEEHVLDSFVNLANDRAKNFDWFDAAVLSFQLSKQLVSEADELLCPQHSPTLENSTESESPWSFP